jgi:hypothetical protein
MDFSNIIKIKQNDKQCENLREDDVGQFEAGTNFVDDPEVPPLE